MAVVPALIKSPSSIKMTFEFQTPIYLSVACTSCPPGTFGIVLTFFLSRLSVTSNKYVDIFVLSINF